MGLTGLRSLAARSIIAAGAGLFLLSIISTPTVAKKVSNTTAGSLLTQCALADDKTDTMGPGLDAPDTDVCCSKSLGYCVECPKDGKGLCDKFPVRERRTLPKTTTTAPESGVVSPNTTIRDHRKKAPVGGVIAPE